MIGEKCTAMVPYPWSGASRSVFASVGQECALRWKLETEGREGWRASGHGGEGAAGAATPGFRPAGGGGARAAIDAQMAVGVAGTAGAAIWGGGGAHLTTYRRKGARTRGGAPSRIRRSSARCARAGGLFGKHDLVNRRVRAHPRPPPPALAALPPRSCRAAPVRRRAKLCGQVLFLGKCVFLFVGFSSCGRSVDWFFIRRNGGCGFV